MRNFGKQFLTFLAGSGAFMAGPSGAGHAQAAALPLRGEGELVAGDTVRDVGRGSLLLQADSTMSIMFLNAGAPETVLRAAWRMNSPDAAELAVLAVGGVPARGAGEIRFRPDGSVDHISARGRTARGEFTLRFDNATDVAVSSRPPVPPARDDARRENGVSAAPMVDVVRHGEGLLTDAGGREIRFDRAHLVLGGNDDFVLVMHGDSQVEFRGTWAGDPRDNPVQLEVREAMGERSGGMGRAWLRERSWDRDWSFDRIELDGWDEDGRDGFRLYFATGDGAAER
ncbi:MAG TPA: hypothetical protein VFM14_00685 [Gemmatimonadales bacterium]|nr:hypothetical protein [Gemmatimonadales bacterium]